jgi:hypothetical protein
MAQELAPAVLAASDMSFAVFLAAERRQFYDVTAKS